MSLLAELTTHFGLSRTDLSLIIETAPARYKIYQIPKKRGGNRTIAHPSRELKAIQRYVLAEKLTEFPVHAAAMAYVKGRGINDNANSHRTSANLLKLDFRDFFPSITARNWESLFKQVAPSGMDLSDLRIYTKILFWGRTPKSVVPRCL
jgi:retron-type reverse transcriptase